MTTAKITKIGSMEVKWSENSMSVKNSSDWVKSNFSTLVEICKLADTLGFNGEYVFAGLISFGEVSGDMELTKRILSKWDWEPNRFIEDISFFARAGSSLRKVFGR